MTTRRHHRRPSASTLAALLEPLEPRALLSATWTTVDARTDLDPSTATTASNGPAMCCDAAGNVYAVVASADHVIREKPAGSPDVEGSWITLASLPNISPDGMAFDASGNLFLTGDIKVGSDWSNPHYGTYELPHGSTTPILLDDAGYRGIGYSIALDPAGNIYTAGFGMIPNKQGGEDWTVRKGTFNPATGSWSFSTVDQFAGDASGLSIVTSNTNGTPSTAIYVVGSGTSFNWITRKSTDGGKTWTQVDASTVVGTGSGQTLGAQARAVTADAAGNVYVGGLWTSRFVTGYKGKNAIYGYSQAWTIRESTNGGASWSIVDSYNYPGSSQSGTPGAMGADLAGNVYAVGSAPDGNNLAHAIIRTNAGGSWATIDDYTGSGAGGDKYDAFAVDSSGNLYAAGADPNGYLVRSAPGPVPPPATMATTSSSLSSDSSPMTVASFLSPSASTGDDLQSLLA